jgi:hypothetical protein
MQVYGVVYCFCRWLALTLLRAGTTRRDNNALVREFISALFLVRLLQRALPIEDAPIISSLTVKSVHLQNRDP